MADSGATCQCWVGHGSCGGCSGYPGIKHEPACGFEWNPDCPVHGAGNEYSDGGLMRLAYWRIRRLHKGFWRIEAWNAHQGAYVPISVAMSGLKAIEVFAAGGYPVTAMGAGMIVRPESEGAQG